MPTSPVSLIVFLALFYTSAQAETSCLQSCSNGTPVVRQGDPYYVPPSFQPNYPLGTGPQVTIDEGHHNVYGTRPSPGVAPDVGRFVAFKKYVEADGYRVTTISGNFSLERLRGISVLVIGAAAGAQAQRTNGTWEAAAALPAYTRDEIDAIVAFVADGGGLFLGINHAPLANPVKHLAARFGVRVRNSLVLKPNGGSWMESAHGASIMSYASPNPVLFTLNFIPGADATTALTGTLPSVLALNGRDLGAGFKGRVVIAAHTGDFTSQAEFCAGVPLCKKDTSLDQNGPLLRRLMGWLSGAITR